jgi:hypothetical protein
LRYFDSRPQVYGPGMTNPPGGTLSLRDAVERFRGEPGSWPNAYEWYRKGAQRSGKVSFGNTRQLVKDRTTGVSVSRAGNRWVVDAAAFEAALAEHRAALAETLAIDQAWKDQRLVVGPGESVRTSWGGYRVAEHFHVSWLAGARQYGGGYESWFCSRCWKPASTEHDRPECHTCRDWGSCGNDCTLSGIACAGCGTSTPLRARADCVGQTRGTDPAETG